MLLDQMILENELKKIRKTTSVFAETLIFLIESTPHYR